MEEWTAARLRPVLDTQELARRSQGPGDAGNDLVRALMKLTSDVERFDSMVVVHRKMLEQRATNTDAIHDDVLSNHSERLRVEAAEIVTDARHALEQLRRLSQHPWTSRSRPGS